MLIKKIAIAVAYANTNLKVPDDAYSHPFNQKLMYYEDRKLWFLFPLAKRCLLDIYHQADAVENLAKEYLNLTIPGRGYIMEFYILHMMKKIVLDKSKFSLECHHMGPEPNKTVTFEIENVQYIGLLPLTKPIVTTLYIPYSSCYPDVDCVIYNEPTKTLYPIRIAINQGEHKDSYENWIKEGAGQSKWQQIFENSCVQFIWIVGIPRNKTGQESCWFATFESLSISNLGYFSIFKDASEKIKTLISRKNSEIDGMEEEI